MLNSPDADADVIAHNLASMGNGDGALSAIQSTLLEAACQRGYYTPASEVCTQPDGDRWKHIITSSCYKDCPYPRAMDGKAVESRNVKECNGTTCDQ